MEVAQRYVPKERQNPHRQSVALLAALLHDVGHGPFSHAFEVAEKARLSKEKYCDHEDWTAKLVCRKDGNIRRILKEEFGGDGSMADDISALLGGDELDLYSSVVSSSFDADRLDYLRRDRMMTGSGAGAFDFDWLLDHPLRVYYAKATPIPENYMMLDGTVVWSALDLSADKGHGPIRDFAGRVCLRKVLKSVSIENIPRKMGLQPLARASRRPTRARTCRLPLCLAMSGCIGVPPSGEAKKKHSPSHR
jgi:HD domain